MDLVESVARVRGERAEEGKEHLGTMQKKANL
jgi:hypothetical protein